MILSIPAYLSNVQRIRRISSRAYIHLDSNLDSLDPQTLSPVNIYQHRDLDL